MRPAPLLLPLLLALGTAHAATPAVPTVIVDIHALGAERVEALKQADGVAWAAEFGNELLLGVEPATQRAWLHRERVREGLGRLAPDEILIRDHVCTHEALQPALGSVGGYELLRRPPMLVRYAALQGSNARPLPADGVVSRERHNQPAALRPKALGVNAEVAVLVARVDAERWFTAMSTLSGYNRNSFSPALGSARNWILQQFEDTGLATRTFGFSLANLTNCGSTVPPPIAIDNPIGYKRGRNRPSEWIVVGAHYDSRNTVRCDGVAEPQPGANDNASGCAGVIELARVYADVDTERSILFMCFSGEEQGLVGSRRYVEALQASGEIGKVKHMINLDMIGYDAIGNRTARVETNAAQQALLARYSAAAATYAPELNLITSSSTGGGSDHWYFLGAGVPAVFTWENGASIYPHYHRATDLPQNMTGARPLAAGILKMDTAMLAEVAGLDTLFGDGMDD